MSVIDDLVKANAAKHAERRKDLDKADELMKVRAAYLAATAEIIFDVETNSRQDILLQDHPALVEGTLKPTHPALMRFGGEKMKGLKEYVDIIRDLFRATAPLYGVEETGTFRWLGSETQDKESELDLSLGKALGKVTGGLGYSKGKRSGRTNEIEIEVNWSMVANA